MSYLDSPHSCISSPFGVECHLTARNRNETRTSACSETSPALVTETPVSASGALKVRPASRPASIPACAARRRAWASTRARC